MKKNTQIDDKLIEWVHFDLRHWQPSQKLDQEIPTDTFSPNTLSHLRKVLYGDHRAQELIAKAETSEWSQQVAEEIFSHLKEWVKKRYQ